MFVLDICRVNQKNYATFQAIQHLKKQVSIITQYWNSGTVTEPIILSWIHEEIKFNCDIKLTITSD